MRFCAFDLCANDECSSSLLLSSSLRSSFSKTRVCAFLCAEDESNERRATLFVSGAKPSPRGGGGGKGKGKDDIIGLEELKTK